MVEPRHAATWETILLPRVFSLICGALLGCVLVACGGEDETRVVSPTAIVTSTPTSFANSTAQPTGTASPLARTEVVRFEPPPDVAQSATGTCFGTSLSAPRGDAWRCSLGNEIFDPCFGAYDAMQVTCVLDPFGTRPPHVIRLLDQACVDRLAGDIRCRPEALPPTHPDEPVAWGFETVNGVICRSQGGGTSAIANGERINYSCSDGTGIVGHPSAGAVWTARQVPCNCIIGSPATPVPETIVQLRKVWW
jgi:hypothetical protein